MIAPTTKVIGCMDDDVEYAAQTLLRKYYGQQGGLIDDVFLQHGQYGGWLGEKTFKKFFRGLPVPVQESLKMIRDVGLTGVRDYAGDVSRGEDWRKAGLRRLGETGSTIASRLGERISRMMSGRGGGRKRNIRRRGATKRGSSSATSGRVGRRRKGRKSTATSSGKRRAPARRRRKTTKRTTKRRRRTTKQKGFGDIGSVSWL
jgi:hypothetical protein